jgi:pectin methylesterase-like acyl-CoA thioesterase
MGARKMKQRGILLFLAVAILLSMVNVSANTSGKVQFFNGNVSISSNTLYLNFKLANTGADTITLSDVKMRYYFNNDLTLANSFACDYATAGSSNITGTIVATGGNERYCEVGFLSGAGTLSAGAGTEVKARVWKSDWSNFDQSNDYSFNSTATNYVDWNKVTLYINGTLYWGTVPGRSNTPTPVRTPAPTITATPFVTPTATPTHTPRPAPTAVIAVAKDGSGQFTTVQAAISSVSSINNKWLTIYIKNGTYREVIHVNKPYIKMIGESNTGTILTYDNCSSTAGSTSGSASIFFEANNFIAENLTFQNTFNYDTSSLANKQAVAAEPVGDRQVFRNCRITGHQDTLYVRKYRQYFKDCYIEGITDYIFGDATAVFDNCVIHTHNKGSGSTMTAPNTQAEKAYGLVFLNCKLTADSGIAAGSITLGRPWAQSGSCHYLYCTLGTHCGAWSNMSSNIWQNARFGEYKSTGPGAVINSNHPQLTDAEAANYTITNILKGNDNWNPNNFYGIISMKMN